MGTADIPGFARQDPQVGGLKVQVLECVGKSPAGHLTANPLTKVFLRHETDRQAGVAVHRISIIIDMREADTFVLRAIHRDYPGIGVIHQNVDRASRRRPGIPGWSSASCA